MPKPKPITVEDITQDINDVAVKVAKLRLNVDPGKLPMIRYLRRMELKLDRIKNNFRDRCARESGG